MLVSHPFYFTSYKKDFSYGRQTSCSYCFTGDKAPPKGSWFHISDSSVQPVTEARVQTSQAYLLFYERIS